MAFLLLEQSKAEYTFYKKHFNSNLIILSIASNVWHLCKQHKTILKECFFAAKLFTWSAFYSHWFSKVANLRLSTPCPITNDTFLPVDKIKTLHRDNILCSFAKHWFKHYCNAIIFILHLVLHLLVMTRTYMNWPIRVKVMKRTDSVMNWKPIAHLQASLTTIRHHLRTVSPGIRSVL